MPTTIMQLQLEHLSDLRSCHDMACKATSLCNEYGQS